MSGTWWTRVFVIIVTLLWGVWMVTPTFVGGRQGGMLEAQAAAASGDDEEAAEQVDGPWWLDLLPEGRINLGLDLQERHRHDASGRGGRGGRVRSPSGRRSAQDTGR